MTGMKAAALIHSRTAFCDFRSNFLAHPADLTQTKINELKEYILQTTQTIEELYDEGDIRRIVYADGDYVVLGMTAYIKTFFDKYNNITDKTIFSEERGRPTYAFVGLVFRKMDFGNITSFPDVKYYASAIEKYLIPRWNERRFEDSANDATMTDYNLDIIFEPSKYRKRDNLNVNAINKVKIFTRKENEDIILESISEASSGKKISTCTNIAYKSDAQKSYFMNVTAKNISNTIICNNGLTVKENSKEKDNLADSYTNLKKDTVSHVAMDNDVRLKKIIGHTIKIGIIVACGAYLVLINNKQLVLVVLSVGAGLIAFISEASALFKNESRENNTSSIDKDKITSFAPNSLHNRMIGEKGGVVNTNKNSEEDIFKL